ncbi:MAG: KTSC domain-containing protein [Alphaproteobacteria bacterium]|nr:KTSC domain-containing protein [Alphaproteobacteria bacterium]
MLRSSAIRKAEYTESTRTLHVWCTESGGLYEYYGVPESVYLGLISAESAGQYINDYIRDRYVSNR